MSQTQLIAPGHVERSIPGTESWTSLHADHLARYFYAAGLVRGRRVLDAGTGPGYGAAILKEAGALRVDAVDIDGATIEQARQNYRIDGLNYLVDDCETFANVEGPFDVITSFENIEHLRHPDRFVEAAARLLTDDGVLLCSSPDRALTNDRWVDGKPDNPFHVNEWYRDEFHSLLSAHFGSVEVYSQVVSLSYANRKRAAANLHEHLVYLWSNPLLKASRLLGKLSGRRQPWPSIDNLAAASPADYPIHSGAVANSIGEPWCHLAVCKEPHR